jgi:hypothetical protein
MTTSARIESMLRRRGRAMVLKRRVGTTAAFTEVSLYGVSRKYAPEELVGGIIQGDREIIIGLAGAFGEPKKNDSIDGGTVQFVDLKYDASAVIAYILTVRG